MITPERNWQTSRLLARPAASADAQVIFENYATDPAVARFMTWKPHRSVDETIEFLRCCEQGWRDTSEFTWSLWMKSDGGFAGLLAIRGRTNGVDLGYALAQRWWRQGLMSEALMWVVEWALSHPEIQPSAAGAILSRRG